MQGTWKDFPDFWIWELNAVEIVEAFEVNRGILKGSALKDGDEAKLKS